VAIWNSLSHMTQKTQKPLSSFKVAYGDWQQVLGILVATVSIVSLIVKLVDLDLIFIFEKVVETYRSIFYTLIDFLTKFAFKIELPPWLKDTITAYLALGGITARSYSSLYQIHVVSRIHNVTTSGLGFLIKLSKYSRIPMYVTIFILWPYITFRLLRQGRMFYKLIDYEKDEDPIKVTYHFNIGYVYFLQTVALLALIVFFILTNIIFI